MFSPEKSQVEICLLKSNLEEIENELSEQRSIWPKFDAENEKKIRESMKAVKASRALSVEIEHLNQVNVRLVAKRMHLKMQSEELAKAQEKARDDGKDMTGVLNVDKQEIELMIRNYENLLREKTARFRETRSGFNEVEMKREIEKADNIINELEDRAESGRAAVEAMKKQLSSLALSLPEDLLLIVGKGELQSKVKSLSEKCNALQGKRNNLAEKRNNASPFTEKK